MKLYPLKLIRDSKMWESGGRGEVYRVGREGMGLEYSQGGVQSFTSQSAAQHSLGRHGRAGQPCLDVKSGSSPHSQSSP